MKTIITIGRQFGSGGKEAGIRVAKELGIPFYDKEILQEAAKKSGLCQKILENFDERPKSLLYSIALAGNPDHLSIFIHAPLEDRVRRVAQRQNLPPEKAKTLISKTDKRRASYYEYYSSQRWGAVDSYDFCINSSFLGLSGTVELIRAMVEHKEHPVPSPTETDPTRA